MNLRNIQALLAIYLREHDESVDEVVVHSEIELLASDGLLAGSHTEGWAVTAKAEAYIQALQSVPLPVQRWVIPETDHALDKHETGEVHGGSGARPGVREAEQDPAKGGAGVQPARRSKRNAKSGDEGKG